MPIFIFTPARRANKERAVSAGLHFENIIDENFQFLSRIRDSYGEFAEKIRIGGMTGRKGDDYKAEEALDAETAEAFHRWQATRLAQAGVDFLFGATLPACTEALGLAKAMASTNKLNILSFVVHPNSRLLDGNSLHDAIAGIDAAVYPNPLGYMVN